MTAAPTRNEYLGRFALVAIMCAWQFATLPVTSAADPDEEELGRPETLRSTLPGDLGRRQLDVLGVRLGADTIATVQERLGPARAFSPGGAGLTAICYTPAQHDHDLAVVYQASANDAARVITVALVGTRSELRGGARHCVPAPEVASLVRGIGGLRPGMSRGQLGALFDERPSEDTQRYLGYFFYRPVAARESVGLPGGSCQLLSGLRARFVGTVLRSFAIYRTFSPHGC